MSVRIASLVLAGALVGSVSSVVAQPVVASRDEIYTVQASRVGASVSFGGTVVPVREVTLAAQMPGRIEFLAGEEGDHFKEGDVLVTIDDDDLRAQRQSAVADLANADSTLRNAGVQFNRELWNPNSPAKTPGMGLPNMFDQFFTRNMGQVMGMGNQGMERGADLYTFGTQIEQARNAMVGAESRLREIDAKLRDTRSLAPFDGVVVQKMVEVGDTVQPGQSLYKYADVQALQIEVDVPARHVAVLTPGMVVPAKLDVGHIIVPVRVAQIFPMADPQRHTVTVKFDVPPGAPAKPGMYVDVRIPDENSPVRDLPVVPKSALVRRGSLHAVFVLVDETRTELRLVRIGDEVSPNYVTILSGVKAEERIIATPRPGMASGWNTQRR